MGRPVLEVADIFRDHGAAWRRANAGYVSLPEFWREVQHLSALSLLDFPFLGAAFASSKYSGRRRRGRENPIFPWCARASQGVALRVRIHLVLSSTNILVGTASPGNAESLFKARCRVCAKSRASREAG